MSYFSIYIRQLFFLLLFSIYHRNYSNAKVISLTGSNGKTTTKELIHAVLSKKYKTIATSKVLNEGVDVPEARVAVVLSGSGSVREHVQRLISWPHRKICVVSQPTSTLGQRIRLSTRTSCALLRRS